MHTNGQVTAIDANYAKQLKVTGLSSLDAALRETTIRTALPDTENEAMTMMTLKKGQTTADEYANIAMSLSANSLLQPSVTRRKPLI